MKISKIFIIIILFVLIVFVITLSFPWMLMLGCSVLAPNPPVPKIIYGEFPFEMEYEIDGQITKVEDVVMCKYDGIGFGDSGKFLKWKKWLASTGEEDLLLLSEGNKKIFCTVGSANYYMGETQGKEHTTPKLYIDEYKNSITISSSDPVELEKYNIKIINYKFSQPIENKFE